MKEAPYLLLKAIEKEYINNYVTKGEICFNPAINFSDETFNDAQHDKYEGSPHEELDPKNHMLFIRPINSTQPPIKLKNLTKIQHNIKRETNNNIPIACFTLLKPSDFYLNENEYFQIKKEVINELYDISNGRPVVISQLELFIDKIKEYPNLNQLGLVGNEVSYYSNNIFSLLDKDRIRNDGRFFLFEKHQKYASQKEYRLALFNVQLEKNKKKFIYIGSIEEFSYIIPNIETLSEKYFQIIDK